MASSTQGIGSEKRFVVIFTPNDELVAIDMQSAQAAGQTDADSLLDDMRYAREECVSAVIDRIRGTFDKSTLTWQNGILVERPTTSPIAMRTESSKRYVRPWHYAVHIILPGSWSTEQKSFTADVQAQLKRLTPKLVIHVTVEFDDEVIRQYRAPISVLLSGVIIPKNAEGPVTPAQKIMSVIASKLPGLTAAAFNSAGWEHQGKPVTSNHVRVIEPGTGDYGVAVTCAGLNHAEKVSAYAAEMLAIRVTRSVSTEAAMHGAQPPICPIAFSPVPLTDEQIF